MCVCPGRVREVGGGDSWREEVAVAGNELCLPLAGPFGRSCRCKEALLRPESLFADREVKERERTSFTEG